MTSSTAATSARWRVKQPSIIPGFGLTLGFSLAYLSLIILIPIAGLLWRTAELGWSGFFAILSDQRTIRALTVSFGTAFAAALINVVFGTLLAWVLTRYRFPGRRLIDAMVDLPFALPTAVSGIALTAVFANNGWLGRYLDMAGIHVAYTRVGVILAMTLIGMPFAVRTVQPALLEVQRDLEDAAETLGAGRWYVFRRVIVPAVLPAMLTGFTLAFARALGEYGSIIFISGNLPMKTEITPLLIVIHLEEFDYRGAAALGFVMLAASFVILLAINLLQAWGRDRMVRRGQ